MAWLLTGHTIEASWRIGAGLGRRLYVDDDHRTIRKGSNSSGDDVKALHFASDVATSYHPVALKTSSGSVDRII
jgi:hypothetical protein